MKGKVRMTCHNCRSECQRFGKHRNGLQRYRCRQCSRTFTEPHENALDGMYLPQAKAEQVLSLLLEGSSVSSTERLTGVHHTTILKLLVLAGEKCERFLGKKLRNIPVRDVQADEIWSFIQKKQKARRSGDDPSFGDCYTFIAIETHTKLVLNVAIGRRDQASTDVFIEGLRLATAAQPFQITTDGFAPYRTAISDTLADRVDFAQLIKVYRATPEGERRYSPRKWSARRRSHASGAPIQRGFALAT